MGVSAQRATRPSRALRMGVIGCADIAERRMIPSMLRQPLVDLVAVASRDAGKAARFAARFGCAGVGSYEALLDRDDIDAVYLPLPPPLHAPWIEKALAAGKHVLCEKPLAATLGEAERAVRAAQETGLLLMESFMFLHHRQHEEVRGLVASGAIGELRSFSCDFAFPPLPREHSRYLARSGSALLEVGVYPIRAAQFVLGPGLEIVGAQLKRDPERDADVSGSALLCLPDGVSAHLTFGLEHSYRCTYALWGSEGRLVLDRAFTPPDALRPTVRIERQDGVREHTFAADRQFVNIVGHFAHTVLSGGPFASQYTAILRQARLVEAVGRQARVAP
ncbi:Gfo/Idh/MocA family protein [Streptomyces sp. HD]|uniref:Gfo/Idh/MocA family protein n=1 Tax=Streptomyces sp. HD TaxID=3020892 RepID=UPI00232FAC63|nr:Gfo/Idh/MocA family oxidoreductase [Streptomyces sp. HD]MDC0772600.1 Gfo/Idh/MocA family oxidoreductase [Streptomyces sp. HD]